MKKYGVRKDNKAKRRMFSDPTHKREMTSDFKLSPADLFNIVLQMVLRVRTQF